MPKGYDSNNKTRRCLLCEEEYVSKQQNQKFCSLKCKTKHWKSNNIERRNEWDRNWQRKDYKRNSSKYIHKNLNREALKRTNGKGLSLDEWNAIKKRYGFLCAACGLKKKLTRDHIIPLIKGGRHEKENIQPLCRSCNSRKKDSILTT